ncbi:hypothetical protein EMCRGX_G021367 [Ephydatia muelleri]
MTFECGFGVAAREKEIRFSSFRRRGTVSVVREHYLRDDISCKVEFCPLCTNCKAGGKLSEGLLGAGCSHYIMPDVSALGEYMEIFENPAMSGLIMLQTVVAGIKSRRHRSRALGLVTSPPHKHCVMFSNEHHIETYTERDEEEALPQWQRRSVMNAAVWYVNHLEAGGSERAVIILTKTPEDYYLYNPARTKRLMVMSVGDYVKAFCSEQRDLLLLYESITASLQDSSHCTYDEHISVSSLSKELTTGEIIQGIIRVNKFRYKDEAFVSPVNHPPGWEGDILIHGPTNRNRAIHDDLVAVRLLPKSEWRGRGSILPQDGDDGASESADVMATGQVVAILERRPREYVASFTQESAEHSRGWSERVLVCPYDVRIPKIRISTRQSEELKNHRIVVCIDSWPGDSQYPIGHFVRTIGPIGDIDTETSTLLIEHGISITPFSKAVLDELPVVTMETPWDVDPEEVRSRWDLRPTHLVFSIDPVGCEDVDDALSVRYLKDGGVELGVHISDVSYFVKPGSLTDAEAQRRSTTVYLADRRYDMLPGVLSANVCSLLSNVNRYAVSTIWELDKDLIVTKVWYGRTVIRSAYKMTYEAAQALFDGVPMETLRTMVPELRDKSPDQLQDKVRELRQAVNSLVTIAGMLKDRRFQQGGVELEGIEIKVHFGDRDQNEIDDLIPKEGLRVHETVAECMIFANHWVAKKLWESFPTNSLLRYHPPPSRGNAVSLIRLAASKGFVIDLSSNKSFADSLDMCVDKNDPSVNMIIRSMAVFAMKPAEYVCTGTLSPEEFAHYGLGLDFYTHFTSPIRRYADVVVHRQLLSAMSVENRSSLPPCNELKHMCDHMNKQHNTAKFAQMASTELYQCLYFAQKRGDRCLCDAVIYDVRAYGVMVMVPRYGLRGPLRLRGKTGQVVCPSSDGSGVEFGTGTLEMTQTGVKVRYEGGEYQLNLLDHVKNKVAHAASLEFQLLSTTPVVPETKQTTSKNELVKSVTAETSLNYSAQHHIGDEENASFTQSSASLYLLLHQLYTLSLAP